MEFKKTEKQVEACRLIAKNRVTCLSGGSRAGKSIIAIYTILARASFQKTRHLVTRYRFAHAKQSLCYDTIPKVIELMGLQGNITLNKTDWFYELWNGSTIWIGGLDDKERTEKILGNEYATIFLNEASQISYEAYEMITTRLNPPKGVNGKIIIDYNPPSISHWGYKMFVEHKLPDGTALPKNDYATIKMNPHDNLENISEDYINQLQYLSAAKRKRFLDGEYTADIGSLWKRGWIKYDPVIYEYERIVVGVDPAGTVGGDEIGIVVSGKIGDDYYVLDDYSLHGTPNEWALEVKNAYEKWKADVVVAEKNFGGDMVESTIKQADRNINVKLINSSRGKIVRAEPISALYEQGKVFHRQPFFELEDEMCNYTPESKDSPDRLDACFDGNTDIITNRGVKKIKYIKKGDYVLTSKGFEEVKYCMCTGIKQTYKYTFSNGIEITSTNNHPVKTKTNEWKAIDKLDSSDIVILWKQILNKLMKEQLYLMASYIGCIKLKTIIIQLINLAIHCIEQFGNIIKVILKKDIKYTILTATKQTIAYPIYSCLPEKSMQKCIKVNVQKEKESILIRLDHLQQNGINQKKAESGTKNTEENHGSEEKKNRSVFVKYVEKNIYHIEKILSCAQKVVKIKKLEWCILKNTRVKYAEKNILTTNIKKKRNDITHVENVHVIKKEINKIQNVYNLEVKNTHEYFANGVLVHNCVFSITELANKKTVDYEFVLI